MTTTFVVLAAGRGSRLGRLGDALPKCLLPLDGRAVLSRQLDLAPTGAKLVVVTGYRADQVEEYLRLAHPTRDVTIVREDQWGRGPGASLLAARDEVEGDLVVAACDTLWDPNSSIWEGDGSWLAVAPVPAGTPAARWCRAVVDAEREYVLALLDKTPDVAPNSFASIALARVVADDLGHFWLGLDLADRVAGEVQLSAGLAAIVDAGVPLETRFVGGWLDVGDERAYRAALAATTGYDPLKPDQLTYVLPFANRVIKWHVDPTKVARRVERAKLLGDAVPALVEPVGATMVGFEYANGVTAYRDYGPSVVPALLDWWADRFWVTRRAFGERPPNWRDLTTKFYRDKTFARVMSLDAALSSAALDAVTRVDWDALIEGCVPGVFHGDLTPANVIYRDDDWNVRFTAIDWREDFAGETSWGDLRYDLGKLLGGTVFHWENARHGDFRRWDAGAIHRLTIEHAVVNRFGVDLDDVRRIAALTLLNSAPLHAAPMDEILVARGCRLLEEVT